MWDIFHVLAPGLLIVKPDLFLLDDFLDVSGCCRTVLRFWVWLPAPSYSHVKFFPPAEVLINRTELFHV